MKHFIHTISHSARAATTLLLGLLMLFAPQRAWAFSPWGHEGSGTPEDPYQISTAQQWMDFTVMVNIHNANYGDKCYKLTADITVSGQKTSAATTQTIYVGDVESCAFRGTFDGGGHTLTFNFTTNWSGAPFRYISGATISNLRVAGQISAAMGGSNAGGIASHVTGNSTISDCTVSSTIYSSGSGAGSHGGLVGRVESGTTLTINRCTFNGSFTGSITVACGGFVGYNLGRVNITDGLFAPTSITIGDIYSFCKDWTNGSHSLTRAYRTYDSWQSNRKQGTRIYTTAPDGQVSKKVSIFDGNQYWLPGSGDTGAASSYYLHEGTATVTYGVTFDGATLTEGTDYDAVIKNSSDQTVGTAITATGTYTLTVTLKGDYAGTMTKTFEVKNGLAGGGTAGNPYIIDSEPAWNLFANMVSGASGYTQSSFSGEVVKLTQDISGISTIAGTDGHPFCGTFDGGGHTMNLSIDANYTNGAAPFGYINGATIKDLTLTGNVLGRTHTAGLVGFSQGTNTIDGCTVNVAVRFGQQAASRHIGGVVGHGLNSTLTIRNTTFGGTLWNNEDYAGGLMGWCDAGCTLTIENSLFNGSYIGTVAFHPIAIRNGDASITVSDLGAYYTATPTLTAVSNIVMSGTRAYSVMPDNEMCQQLTLPDGNDYYIPANISGIETSYTYTGSDISVSYIVKAGNGTPLTEGTHYTVARSYTIVHDAGAYAITFTGKGDYTGSKTFYFTVGDANPSTPSGLSEDPDIAYPNEGHYYVNMPYRGTTTLTFTNSDVNTFKIYDDGGKNGNVQWGTSNTNDYLIISAPEGCTFTVSGSVNLWNNSTGQHVAVYDGHETTNTELANVTGSNTLGPVTSTGNTMMIYYHLQYSGSMYNMPGFALTVTINDPNRQYAVNIVTPDNGSLSASSTTAKAGTTVTLTATPAAGYALDRLTVLDAAQQPVTITAGQFTMPNGPVIAAAKFLPVYSVSFNANGHGTAPDAQSVMQGYTATEPAAPTADGYDFGGWYATSACTGEAYDFGTAVSGNVELFAKWMATTYYLNYDLAGGTVATANPDSYTIESADITLNNPTREGYTFAGWTGTDLDAATETVTIASGSTGDRQYTATWTMTWANVKAALQAGQSVTLANDVTRVNSECIEPSGTVTLDLNGYTIDGGTTQTNPLFRIGDGVSLTITDSQTGGNLCNAGTNPTVSVIEGGSLTLAGGTINAQASGVFMWGGNFNMTGGTITGGSSNGVYLNGDNVSFTMTGGTITGNETGVNVGSANATFTVSGNVNITGNTKNSITTDVSLNYDYQSSTLSPIHIGGALNEAARIGINIDDYAASAITGDVVKVITNGLEGKGTKQNFVLNGRDGHALVTNANGELTIGKIYSLSVPENVTVSGFTTVSTNTYNVGCGDVVTLLYGADNVSSGCSLRYIVPNGAITYLGAVDAQGKCAEFTMPGSDMTITWAADNNYSFGGITLKETFINGNSQGLDATFDGSSQVTIDIPENIAVNSVDYNRTFTEGKPSTVMLPFNKDVSEIGGGTFYTFGGVEKINNKWEATMNEVTGSLTANTPYLFVPAGTSLTFTGGATLNTTGGGNCLASDTEGWEFHGTYIRKVWEEESHDYGFAATSGTSVDGKDVEAGQFVRLTTGASAKPMRCYLSYVGVPAQARALPRGAAATDEELPSSIIVRLVGANGEVTAIGTIDTKTGEVTFDSEAWYTLDGVRLSGKPTKKGLYINNGKKIVIK